MTEALQPQKPKSPPTRYDQKLAIEAAAAEQCMKLGAVLLKPASHQTGFSAPE